jgi:hypothetical protein
MPPLFLESILSALVVASWSQPRGAWLRLMSDHERPPKMTRQSDHLSQIPGQKSTPRYTMINRERAASVKMTRVSFTEGVRIPVVVLVDDTNAFCCEP